MTQQGTGNGSFATRVPTNLFPYEYPKRHPFLPAKTKAVVFQRQWASYDQDIKTLFL